MEIIIFQAEIASRGWHVYGKSVWKNPKKTDNLTVEKETDKDALEIVP